MTRRFRGHSAGRWWLLLLVAALLVAACGDDDGGGTEQGQPATTQASESPEASEPAADVDADASFRYALNWGYGTLDPHQTVSGADDPWLRPVYDTLLRVQDNGAGGFELAPSLATSFEVAEDGLSISFELRDDVAFHDGTPFDAETVRSNIERAKGLSGFAAAALSSVEQVEVVDATHVVLHLSQPDPALAWGMAVTVPGAMVNPSAFDTDLATQPAGSGPFRLVSAQQGGEVVYERVDGYWEDGVPLVARLVITTVQDTNARFNGMQSGQYDAIVVSQPQDTDQAIDDMQAEGFHYVVRPSPSVLSMLLNTDKPPLDDVRVRQAISMALDRPAIVESLLGGAGRPAYQPFPEGVVGYDEALDVDPYDPDAARALIEEAGATGATITLIQQQSPPVDAIAQVVQQALTDIGLNVELIPLNFVGARTEWPNGAYHALVTGTSVGEPTPAGIASRVYLGRPDNPATPPAELVELVDVGKRQAFGSPEEEQAWLDVSDYLAEQIINIPIAQGRYVIATRPNVVNSQNVMLYNLARVSFSNVGIAVE